MNNRLPHRPDAAPVNRREAWLSSCAALLASLFAEQGAELSKFRVTCGPPTCGCCLQLMNEA